MTSVFFTEVIYLLKLGFNSNYCLKKNKKFTVLMDRSEK